MLSPTTDATPKKCNIQQKRQKKGSKINQKRTIASSWDCRQHRPVDERAAIAVVERPRLGGRAEQLTVQSRYLLPQLRRPGECRRAGEKKRPPRSLREVKE